MSARIDNLFQQEKGRIAYLTAGDGGAEKTIEAALTLIEGGVNLLEIGVPFSDPTADGPVIQRAAHRALSAGTSLETILLMIETIRRYTEIPLVLFSYLNPILKKQHTSFFQEAKQAGVDGVSLVDCPLEESACFHQECLAQGLAPIYIVAPSTSPERIAIIQQKAQGLVYYACRAGITGVKAQLPKDFIRKIKQIKSMITLPVVVGFGISRYSQVKEVCTHADGAVVGSLFVKALEENISMSGLFQLVRQVYFNEDV